MQRKSEAGAGRAPRGQARPPSACGDDPIGAITVFEAVEHQLGLKLEGGKKYPLPVLIVDRAEPVTADQ